jgi:hypothetical protein
VCANCVRWIKSKSISENLIAPLALRLLANHDLTVKGKSLVQELTLADDGRVHELRYKVMRFPKTLPSKNLRSDHLMPLPLHPVPCYPTQCGIAETLCIRRQDFADGGKEVVLRDLDAVVLALGSKGMKSVISNSPKVAKRAPELAAAASLGAIDVVACRLWLDRTVPTDTPANVFSRFEVRPFPPPHTRSRQRGSGAAHCKEWCGFKTGAARRGRDVLHAGPTATGRRRTVGRRHASGLSCRL